MHTDVTARPGTKKASHEDWHPAEVVAALRMKGYSLRQLALLNGYTHGGSLTSALRRPYPLAESIIAEALKLKPEKIWPSRYGNDGAPNRGRSGMKTLLPAGAKPSRHRAASNTQRSASA